MNGHKVELQRETILEKGLTNKKICYDREKSRQHNKNLILDGDLQISPTKQKQTKN
jgi:hypothetical protein